MFIVDHCIAPSRLHGLGVFLREPVTAGTVLWRFDPMFDTEMSEDFVASLPREEAEAVYHHAEYFPERRMFRLGNDADIFMNHCDTPTLLDCGDEMTAVRDLEPGEELTCNYRDVLVVGYMIESVSRQAAE